MRKRIISKQEIEEFNILRQNNCNVTFTASQMMIFLKPWKFNSYSYLTILSELGALKKVGVGQYQFTDTPVHIEKLQNAVRENSKRAATKRTPKDSVEKAIDLLKSVGYKVSKPYIDSDGALANPDKPVKDFIKYKSL
jgi:hypothetical protein